MSLGLCLALTSLSAPALSEPGNTVAKEDKIVCKRDRDMELGSHLRAKRTCMKASEWKELDRYTERMLRDSDNQRPGDSTPATGPSPNSPQ
jgi:hypothetical protein